MSARKTSRAPRRQLGQWMTPPQLARQLVGDLALSTDTTVLEPGFGDGSFLLALIDAFMPLYSGPTAERLAMILERNVFGIELDPVLRHKALMSLAERWGPVPARHGLYAGDYLTHDFGDRKFDVIVGNPPFGGTIDPRVQDELDARYGYRGGAKIKKESYAFFAVRSTDLLKQSGRLLFICSDTFLTINTMQGLRRLLMAIGTPHVRQLGSFSEETNHPVVVLDLRRTGWTDHVTVDRHVLWREVIEQTPNFSWGITQDLAAYFSGPRVGDYLVATGGMTTGRNEYFVREIHGGHILEPYEFEFFDDPITVEKAIEKARLGRLTGPERARIGRSEALGESVRNIRVLPRAEPRRVRVPDSRYAYYNKSNSSIIFSPATHVIYWEDDGEAVMTYKRNGDWYLRGVGGRPYFGREGLTWQLVAARLNARYLPPGFILDSGAPAAFLRKGVPRDELFFILGWALTSKATELLKRVINHTRNIQGKDFERLPYPWWVGSTAKAEATAIVKQLVDEATAGRSIDRSSTEIARLDEMFRLDAPVVSAA